MSRLENIKISKTFPPHAMSTDYRCERTVKKVNVGAGQYFLWIEGFTTKKKRIGINLIRVTVTDYR